MQSCGTGTKECLPLHNFDGVVALVMLILGSK